MRRLVWRIGLATVLAMAPGVAGADDSVERYPPILDRSHTVAELEAGIIALPDAPISQANRGGYTLLPGPLRTVGNGDATVQTGIHVLYRIDKAWVVGAGAIFAPNPTTDPNVGVGTAVHRAHSRSYLFLGGEGRYVPLRSRTFEGWIGLTAGAVIVADRFATLSAPTVPSLLGTNINTVNSEGFAVGLQVGADYLVWDRLTIGVTLRGDQWFLPPLRQFSEISTCDPVGDCPTLTGRVSAYELGLNVAYHIPL
jgi:hypothetical protein